VAKQNVASDFEGMFKNWEKRLLAASCPSVRMEQFGSR